MALARIPPIKYLYNASGPVDESDRRNTDNEPANSTHGTQLNQDNRSEHWNLNSARPGGHCGSASSRHTRRQGSPTFQEPDRGIDSARSKQRVSAHGEVRKGIEFIEGKADRFEKSVDQFESDWEDIPNRVEAVESNMAARGPQFEELRNTRVNHSARIHSLEDAVRDMKMQNNAIREELVRRGDIDERQFKNGYDDMGDGRGQVSNQYSQAQEQGYGMGQGQRYSDERDYKQTGYGQPEYNSRDEGTGRFENNEGPYLGLNKFLTPEFATSYRREQMILEHTKAGRGQEEEWNRKRREEEDIFLQEKPRTYEYTAPYQSLLPPPDVNKFFHDSKYMVERSSGSRPSGSQFVDDLKQVPGGLYIIRFNDIGFDDVHLALSEQQSVIRSANGYLLGVARSHNLIILEGDADWTFSRTQRPRRQVTVPHRCVDDAVAILWFPSYEKAGEFCHTSCKNRWRQMDFPTAHSNESHYIPMINPPYIGELDTFLFMEFLNVGTRDHLKTSLQSFQMEANDKMKAFNNNSVPFAVSAVLPPGVQMRRGGRGQMFKPHSKLFVSRFSSLADVSALWDSGIIQQTRQNWGLNGPANIYAIALKDRHD